MPARVSWQERVSGRGGVGGDGLTALFLAILGVFCEEPDGGNFPEVGALSSILGRIACAGSIWDLPSEPWEVFSLSVSGRGSESVQ